MAKLLLLFEIEAMEKKELFWLNGWVSQKELKLSQNRAFLFGDGFFESMRWTGKGDCLLWDWHWDRFSRTISALQFPIPANFTNDYFHSLIKAVLPTPSENDWRVKVVFWRHGDGKYQPENVQLAFMLTVEPYLFPVIQTIKRVALAERIFIPHHPLSWIKSTSCMLYVAASMERERRNLDDLILKNENGYVIEGTYSCLFWAHDKVVYVPDPELGGLDSCMKRYLIHFWGQKGIPVRFVQEKWDLIPKLDWLGFGSGMGLRIYDPNGNKEYRPFLPDWQ